MANVHQRTLGAALAMLDTLSEDGRAKKAPIPMEEHFRLLRNGAAGIYRDEIIASRLMKQLTARFGTRGKTPKFIFLQAFEEELRGGNTSETEQLRNIGVDKTFFNEEKDVDDKEDEDEVPLYGAVRVVQKVQPKTMTDLLIMRNGHLGPLIERPAAMVPYSVFLYKLESQLKFQIHKLGCTQPIFETTWLFEEIKPNTIDESLTFYETLSVRETLDESEETLLKRLKLYKRAFSALTLHFEALRPVLRRIKKCYDHVLHVREHELKEANLTKQNIEHYKKLLDAKNSSVKFEGYKELMEVQHQSLLLLRHIDKQEAAIRTMNEILNHMEFQLSEEHDLRRDSEDQQKLLIVDINDFRRKLGMDPRPLDYSSDLGIDPIIIDLTGEDDGEGDEEGEEEATTAEEEEFVMVRDMSITVNDILILRRAIEIVRKDLKEAEGRMAKMELEYSDVVPRHELLALKQSIIDLETEHNNKKNTYTHLASQVQGLHEQIEHLTIERTRLGDQVAEIRIKVTPRPSWENLGEFIEGGVPRWKSLREGKSSNDTAEKLFLELTNGLKRTSGPLEYYSALGMTTKIPIYMRHDSRVRRRKLSRRDVAVIIHDIWQSRIDVFEVVKQMDDAVEEEKELQEMTKSTKSELFGEHVPFIQVFPEYFLSYFTVHYKNIAIRMEWIYNLGETCKKLQDIDPRLKLFLDILEGRRSENVYHLFRAQMTRLFSGLLHQSKTHEEVSGQVSLGAFIETISIVFPYKTPDQVKRLAHAASKQCNVFAEWSIIKYKKFFTMTDEGFIGGFVNEFMKQLNEDLLSYSQEIVKHLLNESGETGETIDLDRVPSSEKEISMTHFYQCLLALDPSIPDEKIGQAIAWIFMNEVSPPGSEAKVIAIINIIKHNLPTTESPDFSDKVELEFEKAVMELRIKTIDDEDGDILTIQKKMAIKKQKSTTLGNLAMKLKSGALVRFGLPDAKRADESAKAQGPDPDVDNFLMSDDGNGQLQLQTPSLSNVSAEPGQEAIVAELKPEQDAPAEPTTVSEN